MASEFFTYSGPATIAGVHFGSVELREERTNTDEVVGDYLRTWRGRITTSDDLSAEFLNTPTAKVELPDGRTGTVHLSIGYDGIRWTVDITGTGPAPGMADR